MENRTTISCSICLGDPKLPVTAQCGHIFCWPCLKKWLSKKITLECPVCRNGIEQDRIIKLHTDKEENPNEEDDRPKVKKIDPQKNKNKFGFFRRILNNYGFFGIVNQNAGVEQHIELPDAEEVKRNIASLGILIIACVMLYYFFTDY
ncbi:MAG: hypothetical protein MJ252_22645 [archaeon]|nr:hypothetical protein [archaeon]